MQLRNNHPLGSIDHKGALGGHVRNQTQINLLFDGFKVFVLLVVARKTKLGFERNIVGQTPLNALLNAVTRRVHEIIEEFQYKVVAGIRYRKVLSKNPVQSVVLTMLRKGLQLKKVFEGFELNVQEIRIIQRIQDRRKGDASFGGGFGGQGEGIYEVYRIKTQTAVEAKTLFSPPQPTMPGGITSPQPEHRPLPIWI